MHPEVTRRHSFYALQCLNLSLTGASMSPPRRLSGNYFNFDKNEGFHRGKNGRGEDEFLPSKGLFRGQRPLRLPIGERRGQERSLEGSPEGIKDPVLPWGILLGDPGLAFGGSSPPSLCARGGVKGVKKGALSGTRSPVDAQVGREGDP